MGTRETFSSMSPGSKIAMLLDGRRNSLADLSAAEERLDRFERDIREAILADPVSFDSVITINYRKLEKIFGSSYLKK